MSQCFIVVVVSFIYQLKNTAQATAETEKIDSINTSSLLRFVHKGDSAHIVLFNNC